MIPEADRTRRYLRIGWPWGDPEWPDLPPAVITTDRVKRDFDMLRARMGLTPLHFPEPSDPSDLFDRIRSGVRVDKGLPLTFSSFVTRAPRLPTEEELRASLDRMARMPPQPATYIMSPSQLRGLQRTAEYWRDQERELNYELHRLARGWRRLRLVKRWGRYKAHHRAAGNARAFACYLDAGARFNL